MSIFFPIPAWLQAQELIVLLGGGLGYLFPIALACKLYGKDELHWRHLTILATVLFSWIGFLTVRCIRAGVRGYVDAMEPPGGPVHHSLRAAAKGYREGVSDASRPDQERPRS